MRIAASRVDAVLGGRPILGGVDLVVEPGQFVALVGPNGSGKSTLLRCIYRVLHPTTGTVHLDDHDVHQLRQREVAQMLAVVVQEPEAEFDFTVADLVMMGRTPHQRVFDRTTADDHRLVADAMERTATTDLAARRFATLSGGEKQRVLLARALAQQPDVLVLDEPTNHLDIHHQLELLDIVRSAGTTTIAALHDLNLAARFSHQVVVLHDGRVVAAGSPVDVLTAELIAHVFRVAATVHVDGSGRPHFSLEPLPSAR